MISAFGVDHGDYEVSKAGFGLGQMRRAGATVGGIGHAVGLATQKAGGALRGQGNKVFGAVRANPHPSPGFNTGARKIGAGYAKAGGKLQKLGGAMMKKPGLTGGVALGSVAAAPAAVGLGTGIHSGMKQGQKPRQTF